MHHRMTEWHVNNAEVVVPWFELYSPANFLEGLRKATNLLLNRSIRSLGLKSRDFELVPNEHEAAGATHWVVTIYRNSC
jgi:hypothetical protein